MSAYFIDGAFALVESRRHEQKTPHGDAEGKREYAIMRHRPVYVPQGSVERTVGMVGALSHVQDLRTGNQAGCYGPCQDK
jgi:hypothetical protein